MAFRNHGLSITCALYYRDLSGTLKWREQQNIFMYIHIHKPIYTHFYFYSYFCIYLSMYWKSWVHTNICNSNPTPKGMLCILPFQISNIHLPKWEILFPFSSVHSLTCSIPLYVANALMLLGSVSTPLAAWLILMNSFNWILWDLRTPQWSCFSIMRI